MITWLAETFHSVRGVERLYQRILFEQFLRNASRTADWVKGVSPQCKVLAGPFTGMQYPGFDASGSSMAPKFLGTYESELAHYFTPEQLAEFELVVDVGCAEGYYANGVAFVVRSLNVLAYDMNPQARELCKAMAQVNGLEERVQIRECCTSEDLIALESKRTLIISDCEGFEQQLFTPDVCKATRKSDVLIEVHEHLGASLKDLMSRFSETHSTEVIRSLTDLEKAKKQPSDLMKGISLSEKALLVAECRPTRMVWLYARAKG